MNIEAVDFTFIFFLAVCAYTDIKYRKVFNWSVIAAVISGLGLNLFFGGLYGFGASLLGLFTGFALLLPFYLLGGIGAGDVKYLAAVGCLKGAGFVLAGGAYGAVIGGIFAVFLLLRRKKLLAVVKDIFSSLYMLAAFRDPKSLKLETAGAGTLPYTVFLSMGMLLRFFSGI